MANTDQGVLHSGRSNTVLVFGHDGDAAAFVSSISVRIVDQVAGERVRFPGPATFEDKTINHIKSVILPMVDRVCEILGLPKKSFTISVANLSAASIMDVSLRISGYSADVPIALAMLSACLEMAVPQDIAVTGHIASIDGDIRMVGSIPAKLKAAIKEKTINVFIHPGLERDGSLGSLSPEEKERVEGAIRRARRLIRTIAVHNMGELTPKVFSDEQVVLSSLRLGFYQASIPFTTKQTPIERTVQYLAEDHEHRFWKALERQLLDGRNNDAKGLFQVFARFYAHRKRYPKGLGHKILQLLQSLPPETRRLKIVFPLLPMSECIQLIQFAQESDFEDVPLLFRAVSGRVTTQMRKRTEKSDLSSEKEGENSADKLRLVLSGIDEEALTLIGLPIDSARAAYVMESITVKSYDAFLETITSFYIHLMRYIGKISDPVDRNVSGAEAIALLERAFSGDGGFNKALSDSNNGTNGGLRHVLDMMTARFKREEKEKHVNLVLKMALDPLGFDEKTDLIGALLKRLEPHLPPEIVSQPPERYAGHYETIVRAYVQSMDKMKSLLNLL